MDLIERQAAIESIMKAAQEIEDDIHLSLTMAQGARSMVVEIERLPSAEPDLDQWCTDCKEYDAEKHHCPRYNRVIREALKDAKPRNTGEWSFFGDNMFKCTSCGVAYTTRQLNALRTYTTDPYFPKFCPNCGTDMRGEA